MESKLKEDVKELELRIKQQGEDLDSHMRMISILEKDKLDLMQSNQDQNILIENLYSKIQAAEADAELKTIIEELNAKLRDIEVEHNQKLDEMKREHAKEVETLETFYSTKSEETERNELEEYRISNELNNIHVEEQIELLVREKQMLLEKLKNLSGVSSTDSLTFEKMDHSDLRVSFVFRWFLLLKNRLVSK